MKAIVAVDENFGIGINGKLPWPKNSDDFKWFKEFTLNNNIIVGRNTFNELPNLKSRKVYVFTSSEADYSTNKNGCSGTYLDSEYIKWSVPNNNKDGFEELKKDLIVCGGAQLYRYLIPKCDELFITHINGIYECDTYFPYTKAELLEMFPKNSLGKEINGGKIVRYFKS